VREHSVHYYDDDARFAEVVVGYLAAGLEAGERVLAIATRAHLRAIERGLGGAVDVRGARESGMLQTPDAARTLALFMVDGSPDPERFSSHVGRRVREAGRNGTPVRAFGEMVALLWQQGNVVGAIELEGLWNDLLQRERFSLLCAYPTSTLAGASLSEINRVCHLHSGVRPPSGYSAGSAVVPVLDGHVDLQAAVFLPVPEAVGATRRFVAGVLDGWDLAPLDWDASVVVSELANNAVRHGASSFRVLVSRADGVVRVGVQDAAPGRPLPRSAAAEDVHGRGLAIVSAFSRGWGYEPLAEGKFTWAELALPDPRSGGVSR
jgi:anti-sigma regulatory factor (Ser/Thr protein kinase)